MSPSATERDLEMLAWLAERDMEAVQHAHRQFMAATEPDDVASLGRTYQKVSRCLRTTLALKMKAAEKLANDAARRRLVGLNAQEAADARAEARMFELQDAVERVAAAAIPDPEAREAHLSRFDAEMDDWVDRPDFITDDLDEQVARACRLMGLPEELAARWRALPRPPIHVPAPADDDAPPGAANDPPPRRDSG